MVLQVLTSTCSTIKNEDKNEMCLTTNNNNINDVFLGKGKTAYLGTLAYKKREGREVSNLPPNPEKRWSRKLAAEIINDTARMDPPGIFRCKETLQIIEVEKLQRKVQKSLTDKKLSNNKKEDLRITEEARTSMEMDVAVGDEGSLNVESVAAAEEHHNALPHPGVQVEFEAGVDPFLRSFEIDTFCTRSTEDSIFDECTSCGSSVTRGGRTRGATAYSGRAFPSLQSLFDHLPQVNEH